MADFASVYGMANRPTVAQENPLQTMGQMLQMKNLAGQGQLQQQQIQMGQMQQQQLGQQLQDAQELRSTIRGAIASGEDPTPKVAALGSPLSQSYVKNMTDLDAARTKLGADKFKLLNDHLAKVGNDLGAARTPQEAAQVIQTNAQQGGIPGPQAQELLASLPSDPQQFQVWQALQATKLGATKDLVTALHNQAFGEIKTTPMGLTRVQTPLTGGTPTVTPISEVDMWNQPQGVLGPDGKPMMIQTNKKTGEVREAPGGFKPIPPASVQLNIGKGPMPSSGDTQADLASLSPADQALVKQLASRQIMVGRAGGFQLNNPRNQSLYSLAVRLNPSLSVADNAAYQKFVTDLSSSSPNSSGGRVDSANRMLGHANDLIDALGKLNPGSGVTGKIGNVLSYPGEKVFGDTMNSVDFIKSKLMAEVNKLVTGGVPHAEELKRDIENTPITATKEQWGGLIKSIAAVGMEQIYATEEKRSNLLGSMDPGTSLLSAKAQENLKRISKYAGVPAPELKPPSGKGYTTSAMGGWPGQPASVLNQPKNAPKDTLSLDDYLKGKGF